MIGLFVDPSINNIGWALWDIKKRSLICYGLYRTCAKGDGRYKEIVALPDYFKSTFEISDIPDITPDVVVVEMAAHYDYFSRRRKGHDILKRATQAIITSFQAAGFETVELPVMSWKGNRNKYQTILSARAIGAKIDAIIKNTGGKLKKFPDHVADAIVMGDFYCKYKLIQDYAGKSHT